MAVQGRLRGSAIKPRYHLSFEYLLDRPWREMTTFARIREIWDTGDILAMQAVWGDEPDAAACDEILEMLEGVARFDGRDW